MKTYLVEPMKTKEIYKKFIKVMLERSDAFSLVYFKYRETEIPRRKVRITKKKLEDYLIYSHRGNEWPAMMTMNEFGHIYEIALYRADPRAADALNIVNDVFDWDYPKYPMDLCFYKDGYGWFSCCSHEQYADINTDDATIIEELKAVGVELNYDGEIDESNLFFDEKAVL